MGSYSVIPRIAINEVVRLKRWKSVWFYIPVLVGIWLVALAGDRAVTVLSQGTFPDRGRPIVIDAGHGGEDGGATSCTGVLESGINLEIALRLQDALRLLGYETHMTRTTAEDLHTHGDTIAARKRSDLTNRVARVNGVTDGVLLSIHQNTYPDSIYRGSQVFYAGTEGSRELALALQTNLSGGLGQLSNRSPKRAKGIYLMDHITLDGVLIECGFLSNPQEEALLRSEAYQKKLVCVIAATLAQYLSNT